MLNPTSIIQTTLISLGLTFFSFNRIHDKRPVSIEHFFTKQSQRSSIHTLRAGDLSTMIQPAHQELRHTHSYTNGAAFRSTLGFSILLKDTSTCRPEESGIEPLILWLVDDTLYLLSHNRPRQCSCEQSQRCLHCEKCFPVWSGIPWLACTDHWPKPQQTPLGRTGTST